MAYVIGCIAFLALLRGLDNGRILIWFAIIAAWGTDTFAYLIGKRFGKHKLCPISPKKSIEGAIAGTFTPFGIAGGVAGAAAGGFLGSTKDALTGEMGDEN